MRYARIAGTMGMAMLWTAFATRAADLPGCTAPAGFQDNPHPVIAPMDQLVSHTEEIVIGRPLVAVAEAMDKPLKETIRQSKALPGVAGDFMLTKGDFGPAGSRHIVCLTDGGSVEEECSIGLDGKVRRGQTGYEQFGVRLKGVHEVWCYHPPSRNKPHPPR